jgi:hypothetical protein
MTTLHRRRTSAVARAASNAYAPRRPSLSRRLGSVLIAARLLGIEHDGRTLAWCPACGVETGRRGAKLRRDGTSRVGVAPSHLGWRCYGCQAGGSAADLVSWHRYRRPVAELSRDELRALGEHVDAVTGDVPEAPVRPASATAVPPSAVDRQARARAADDRRWQSTLGEAALYLRDLLARTGTRSEREAWRALERFEPPPGPETSTPIRWRGQRITWEELHAAWLSSSPGRPTHRAGVNRRTNHVGRVARGLAQQLPGTPNTSSRSESKNGRHTWTRRRSGTRIR